MTSLPTAPARVVAVVVAWNRRELLRQCLDGLEQQTAKPAAVLVIDNASDDGSGEMAAAHSAVSEVITMPFNTGGAGGFAAGIAAAINRHAADLVWIMDDDTVPTDTALAALLDARSRFPQQAALFASRADWHDGREHPMNTPRTRMGATRRDISDATMAGAKPIRSASFVSILFDADVVKECGLPKADYFLWNDDFEYTARILRHHKGLYVPASRVRHLTKTFGDSSADPGPRFYNEVRNKTWLFTRSHALAPWEICVYGGSTLRRWGRTIWGSGHRSVLLKGLWKGLRDGLTKPPRPNTEVLAHTPVAADISAVDRP